MRFSLNLFIVALKHLRFYKLPTLQVRRPHTHIDALFLFMYYLGSNFCPSLLDLISLGVPTCNV
jgi:hypothetical protein